MNNTVVKDIKFSKYDDIRNNNKCYYKFKESNIYNIYNYI
jgi:hypothetical protein